MLRFDAKSTAVLLVSGDAQIRDEFALSHCSPREHTLVNACTANLESQGCPAMTFHVRFLNAPPPK
jgi:hypothetical protein